MKEATLRKMHRRLGIILALFVILQAASGFILSVYELAPHGAYGGGPPIWLRVVYTLHFGLGGVGSIYRILLGLGLMVMALSGSSIYFKIKQRGVSSG
jgi:hypothetical protein